MAATTATDPGNDAPDAHGHRLRLASSWAGAIVGLASALLALTAAQAADFRGPWLKGIEAITVSVAVFVNGIWASDGSSCHLDRAILERRGAEVLRGAGLNPIAGVDKFARLQALQAELDDEIRAWRAAPPGTIIPGLKEQAERDTREERFLGAQPFFFIHVGLATLDNGLCAAGIDTELRAFAREEPVINYNGEQQLAPLSIWGAPPLALAVPAAEVQRAVGERLDRQITEFISAWRAANGR
jgi:hypothetical protein